MKEVSSKCACVCVCVFPMYRVNGSRGFVEGYKQVAYRVFSNRCMN